MMFGIKYYITETKNEALFWNIRPCCLLVPVIPGTNLYLFASFLGNLFVRSFLLRYNTFPCLLWSLLGDWSALWISFSRALIPLGGLHPLGLITSQRPPLLTHGHWDLTYELGVVEGHSDLSRHYWLYYGKVLLYHFLRPYYIPDTVRQITCFIPDP